MIKLVLPGSFGFDGPLTRRVKYAGGRMGGNDRAEFLKFAGHDFLEKLSGLRPGEVPIHLLALGTTEAYSYNRNGDGFKAAMCARNHDTFVKDAHYFFNHANRPHDLRFGRVVASTFNDPMQRVELLIGAFETKEAAERDHPELGRVATSTLEKLARDGAVPVSMACTVRHDVCSFCENEARHRGEYCDVVPVKLASRTVPACSGFGCRHGLTKVANNGRTQGVDNPDARWFDISEVPRNADRIAYALGRLEKAAGAVAVGGAEMAERAGLFLPPAPATKIARHALELSELARLEHDGDTAVDLAVCRRPAVPEPPSRLEDTPHEKAAAFLALADARVLLDVGGWLTLHLGKEASASVAPDVEDALPGVARDMATRLDAVDHVAAYRGDAPMKWASWARDLVAEHSLAEVPSGRRVKRAAVRGIVPQIDVVKSAGVAYPAAVGMAERYTAYRADFLASFPADDPALPDYRRMAARMAVVR